MLGSLIAGLSFLISKADLEVVYNFYVPLAFAGAAFGWWIGPIAWCKIYVEGVRGKKYVVNK